MKPRNVLISLNNGYVLRARSLGAGFAAIATSFCLGCSGSPKDAPVRLDAFSDEPHPSVYAYDVREFEGSFQHMALVGESAVVSVCHVGRYMYRLDPSLPAVQIGYAGPEESSCNDRFFASSEPTDNRVYVASRSSAAGHYEIQSIPVQGGGADVKFESRPGQVAFMQIHPQSRTVDVLELDSNLSGTYDLATFTTSGKFIHAFSLANMYKDRQVQRQINAGLGAVGSNKVCFEADGTKVEGCSLIPWVTGLDSYFVSDSNSFFIPVQAFLSSRGEEVNVAHVLIRLSRKTEKVVEVANLSTRTVSNGSLPIFGPSGQSEARGGISEILMARATSNHLLEDVRGIAIWYGEPLYFHVTRSEPFGCFSYAAPEHDWRVSCFSNGQDPKGAFEIFPSAMAWSTPSFDDSSHWVQDVQLSMKGALFLAVPIERDGSSFVDVMRVTLTESLPPAGVGERGQ